MADLTPPTGRVHWIGTGMSTGSGLGLVCDGTPTILWGRTVHKAEDCLARLGLTKRAKARAFDTHALASDVIAGDVIVSMLPASEHPSLVELALEHRAHFVCSSYVSPGISAHADTAREHGLVVLTEIGVDPGIDHLLARELVRKARSATGDQPAKVCFTSYCGSNPAVPNDFRYRFSWAPRGVLTALLAPARLIHGGVEKEIARPWEAVAPRIIGEEKFEVYPNRDSVPFIQTYAFPPAWTIEEFVRGTLRLDGWSHAWKQVFAELVHASDTRISELAEQLAARYPTTPSDRDRLVMSVRLELDSETGNSWTGEYALDVVGDEQENATPRLVSVPLACGILDVVAGKVMPGLHQAADDPVLVVRWLESLRVHGIAASFHGDAEAV
jgi:hypothetical protein